MNPDAFIPVITTSGWNYAYLEDGEIAEDFAGPDFAVAQELGVQGVIHRIGFGMTLDQSCSVAHDVVRDTDMAFGVSYGVDPNYISASDAASIVDAWLKAGEIDIDLPVVLMVDEYRGSELPKHKLGEYLFTLVAELKRITGRDPIIYTSPGWWNQHVEVDLSHTPLIAAFYPLEARQHVDEETGETTLLSHVVDVPASEWTSLLDDVLRAPGDAVGLRKWSGWQFTRDLNVDITEVTEATRAELGAVLVREYDWLDWSALPLIEPKPVNKTDEDGEKVDISGWPPFRPAQGMFSLWPIAAKPEIDIADTGDHVKYAQGVIKLKAGGRQNVNGIADAAFIERVRDIQAEHEIQVTGRVDEDTWTLIDRLSAVEAPKPTKKAAAKKKPAKKKAATKKAAAKK